jgi:hypothetical protein
VLFAVMVLGLGFIMIAAMFPVTIRQTQATLEEATAANMATGAMDYLQTVASEQLFPVTVPPVGNQPNLAEKARVVSLLDVNNVYLTPPVPTYPHPWYGRVSRATGTPTPLLLPAYSTVRGNLINPENPRYAWVPLYRREANSPFAQVFIFVLQCRNKDFYLAQPNLTGQFPDRNYSDLDVPADAPANAQYSTIDPKRIMVGVQWGENTPYGGKHGVVTIDPNFTALAASGAYIVIANDPNANLPLNPTGSVTQFKGQSNGRVYQLGNPIDEARGIWELAPGYDMIRNGTDQKTPQAGDDNELPPVYPYDDTKTTFAYIVGRGYKNPLSAAEGVGGPSQDIAVYTGFIHIPPAVTTGP